LRQVERKEKRIKTGEKRNRKRKGKEEAGATFVPEARVAIQDAFGFRPILSKC